MAYKDNTLSAEKEIRSFLSDRAKKIRITLVRQTGSTNDDMKKAAQQGEDEISLLVAESQTKGKGSKGRSFFSPEGTGCYMSFLLRPTCSAEMSTLLTPMAAAATAEAIEKATGVQTKIKWVNDIFVNDKKVAGILTEGAISKDKRHLDWAVVGIGINITEPEVGFPEEIKNIAGSLAKDSSKIKNRLIAEIINTFVAYYDNLTDRRFYESYRNRLFILGKKITVTGAEGSYPATAVDIDSMFRLTVRLDDGSEKLLGSGEISLGSASFAK